MSSTQVADVVVVSTVVEKKPKSTGGRKKVVYDVVPVYEQSATDATIADTLIDAVKAKPVIRVPKVNKKKSTTVSDVVYASENIESITTEDITETPAVVSEEVVSKPTKKRTTKPKKNTQEVVISENIESITPEVVQETLEVPSEVVVSEEVASKPTKKRTTKPKKNTQEVVVSENIESITPELMSEVMPEIIVNVSDNVIADNHVGETYDNCAVGSAVGADNQTFAIMDNIISNTLENNTYDLITQTQTQIDEYIHDDDFEDILAESFVYEGVSYFIDEENRIFHPQTLLQIGVFQPNTLSVTFL